MRNITVSVDDDTYRQPRIRAAELDTSVSALVRERSDGCGAPGPDAETERERRGRLLDEVFEDIRATRGGFRAADNVSRGTLYDAGVAFGAVDSYRMQAGISIRK